MHANGQLKLTRTGAEGERKTSRECTSRPRVTDAGAISATALASDGVPLLMLDECRAARQGILLSC